MKRDGVVVKRWLQGRHYHHVAAVDKLLTLNCLGGSTKQYMEGATIDWFVFTMCITLIELLYMTVIYVYPYVSLFAPTEVCQWYY